jgi:hypothetical protein
VEEVWRSLFGLERRPVISLNGAFLGSFRRISKNFVKECNLFKKAARHCLSSRQKTAAAITTATPAFTTFLLKTAH